MDWQEKLTEGLNPEQLDVVLHEKGPCLVAACAGSGKTTAVVRRMAYLSTVRGVDPSRIFGTTFSRSGATEMNSRVQALLNDNRVQVQTFHAFCRRVLAEEMEGFDRWALDEREQYRNIVKEVISYKYLDWELADLERIESFIGIAKSYALTPETAQDMIERCFNPSDVENMTKTFALAEKMRVEARLMTFADWMVEVHNRFKDEAVRRRWANLFEQVIVDEGQDNNFVQTAIMEQLGRDHRNVMLVGDANQAIFRFTGAIPEYFIKFPETWNSRVISLHRNYRSGHEIIAAANVALSKMTETPEISRRMTATREDPGEVTVKSYENQEEESADIAQQILALHEDQVPWGNIVILYRTNMLSRPIEEAFIAKRIPYRVVGSSCFYARKEVASLLSYLKVVQRKGATMDDVMRTLRSPHRMLAKAFMQRVEQASEERPSSFGVLVERAIELSAKINGGTKELNGGQKASARAWGKLIDDLREKFRVGASGEDELKGQPADLLQEIVDRTGFLEWIRHDEGRESVENDRISNVAELIRAARDFRAIGPFIEHVKRQVAAFKANSREGTSERVTLMSCHRSKGLEWPHVFLITCNQGVMPHVLSTDPEEERRIFYVAITRARDALHLSFVRTAVSRGKERKMTLSPFIAPFSELIKENSTDLSELMSDDSVADPNIGKVIPMFGKDRQGRLL